MTSLVQKLNLGAKYRFVCRNPDGDIKWIHEEHNLIPNEGLDHALDVLLSGGTQITSWFVGLIDNTSFTEVAADDTAAKIALTKNHPTTNDWQELDDYSQATRPAFTDGGVSGQSLDNSASPAAFSINATVTVNGAFLVSSSTKGGATGTLFSCASFTGGNKAAANGDTLNVTVTVSSQDV